MVEKCHGLQAAYFVIIERSFFHDLDFSDSGDPTKNDGLVSSNAKCRFRLKSKDFVIKEILNSGVIHFTEPGLQPHEVIHKMENMNVHDCTELTIRFTYTEAFLIPIHYKTDNTWRIIIQCII